MKEPNYQKIQQGKDKIDELVYRIQVVEQYLNMCSPEMREELMEELTGLNRQLDKVIARVKKEFEGTVLLDNPKDTESLLNKLLAFIAI